MRNCFTRQKANLVKMAIAARAPSDVFEDIDGAESVAQLREAHERIKEARFASER